MPGTVTGGRKAAATNKKKYGDDFYKRIGSEGGKITGKKGFAVSGKAQMAGRKGGRISRRVSDPLATRKAREDFQGGFDLSPKRTLLQRLLKAGVR